MEAETPITPLLEELRTAFIQKGADVDRFLRSGLFHEEVVERAAALPFELPEEIVELYGWHDGQQDDAEFEPGSFVFRDNTFISLDRAVGEYGTMLRAYREPMAGIDVGFDLEGSFPFATYEGSYHVIVCGPHRLDSPSPRPIVNVYQGIDLFFHSFESMLRTCIDWVRHPQWSTEKGGLGAEDDIEREIWLRHNPGVFA
jgi:hypothetical protein